MENVLNKEDELKIRKVRNMLAEFGCSVYPLDRIENQLVYCADKYNSITIVFNELVEVVLENDTKEITVSARIDESELDEEEIYNLESIKEIVKSVK